MKREKKKKYDCNNLMAKQLLGTILILIRSVHAFKKHHRESEVKCVNTLKVWLDGDGIEGWRMTINV